MAGLEDMRAVLAKIQRNATETVALSESLQGMLQSIQARENTAEARAVVQRIIPENLRETPETTEPTAAGACFRRVNAILARKGV